MRFPGLCAEALALKVSPSWLHQIIISDGIKNPKIYEAWKRLKAANDPRQDLLPVLSTEAILARLGRKPAN